MSNLLRLRGLYAERGLLWQVWVLLLLMGGGLCLMTGILVVEISVEYALDAGYDPEVGILGDMRLMCIVQDICVFILPAVLGAWLFFRRPLCKTFALHRVSVWSLCVGIVAFVVLIPWVGVTEEWNTAISLPWEGLETYLRAESEEQRLIVERLLHDGRMSILLYNLLVIALLAGVSEELFFRGLLMRMWLRWTERAHWKGGVHLVVWGTAIIFSAIHLDFYGFLPRMLLGGMLGYLCVYVGLWASIAVHTLNNAMTVLCYPGQPYNADWAWAEWMANYPLSIPLLIVCAVVGVTLFAWLARRQR
jgi:membrane protease YdiL (CAAX protease family)